MRKLIIIIVSFLLVQHLEAQTGGEKAFSFLDIPNTARETALSSSSIAVWDHDINLALTNPSLLDSLTTRHLSLNYNNYVSDISFGMVAYAHHFKGVGNFAFGLNYFDYGKFDEALPTGQKIGHFTASDKVFNVSYSRPLNTYFQMGASLKYIYSHYYHHTSQALALDAGLTYHNDKSNWVVALLLKNMGKQLTPFVQGNYEPLPFDVQLGMSKKFAHAPFLLTVMLNQLNNWNLRYDSPLKGNNTNLEGVEEAKKESQFSKAGNEFLRHVNLGVEVNPLKSIYLRLSYSFRRAEELALEQSKGMVGFGLGLGFRISKFHISYAYNTYHIAGVSHTFSLTSNLALFFKGSSRN